MSTHWGKDAWWFAVFLVSASPAVLADYSGYTGSAPTGDVQLEDYTGTRVEIPEGGVPGYAGYAEGSTGRAGGWVRVVSPQHAGEETYAGSMSIVEQERRIVALPGSGLNPGDPVTLSLDLRLDGVIDSDTLAQNPAGDLSGNFEVFAYLDIYRESDPADCPPVDEGLDCGGIRYGGEYGGGGEWLGGFNADVFKSFDVTSNTRTVVMNEGSGYWSFYDLYENEQSGDLGDPLALEDLIDTGPLSFTFQANVGDRILLSGIMDLWATLYSDSGTNGWFALEGDFLHTFGFSLTPVTAGAGVAPVPVPAAVWLFGAGLLGLLGVARRRR